MSRPYLAAVTVICSGDGGCTVAGGSVRSPAGSDISRTKPSKPAGSTTSRKRAWRADEEGVRDIAREVDERAGGGRRHATGPEGQLALADVEPLVLVVVNVQRRPVARGAWCSMTATAPFVVSADDLIVRSAPRNQRASPSPGCIAMAVRDALGALGASGIDMAASLSTPRSFVQLRGAKGVGLRRSVAEHDRASSKPSDRRSGLPAHYRVEACGVTPGVAPQRRASAQLS